jgi:Flp pilus assembly protein TadG
MLAFSIDIGYVALVAADLQTAADAAALAGAERLQELYVRYTLPGQSYQNDILTAATTHTTGGPMAIAEAFASYNKAGNVNITVRDQDVTFSYLDASGTFHTNYWAQGLTGGFPNSITVVARRDNVQNTPLLLFFGPIFGFTTKNLTATATATIYSGDVTSLRAIPGITAHILPVALDVNVWKTFYATGLSPDGVKHLASNGDPQLHVYPLGPWDSATSTNTPGSFGLIDVGPPTNSVPAFRNWIDTGETPNDINWLVSNGMLPVSQGSPKNWKVGPGLKSTLQPNFYSQLGVPNLIPLFMPETISPTQQASGWQGVSTGPSYVAANGTGQNATYAVVGFAGVTITQADGNGSNMDISIQPYANVDPTAFVPNPKPAGTQTSEFGFSTKITTFISAKLTQ